MELRTSLLPQYHTLARLNRSRKPSSVIMRDYKEFKELCEAKRGLYANIHAKRKRGEAPARPGSKDYPAKDAFKKAARTAKESFELTTEASLDQKGRAEEVWRS